MSLYDAFTIPVIFFLLFVTVGIVYYETGQFTSAFASYNATMNHSNQTQVIYAKFLDINTFNLDTMNLIVVGLIFMIILISLLAAAVVYAHPGFFPILIFLAGGVVFLWYAMNYALDTVIAFPWLNSYFDPVNMSWFYILKENMYKIIALIVGGIILVLFMKGGTNEGAV